MTGGAVCIEESVFRTLRSLADDRRDRESGPLCGRRHFSCGRNGGRYRANESLIFRQGCSLFLTLSLRALDLGHGRHCRLLRMRQTSHKQDDAGLGVADEEQKGMV